jgi:hypothetical protein
LTSPEVLQEMGKDLIAFGELHSEMQHWLRAWNGLGDEAKTAGIPSMTDAVHSRMFERSGTALDPTELPEIVRENAAWAARVARDLTTRVGSNSPSGGLRSAKLDSAIDACLANGPSPAGADGPMLRWVDREGGVMQGDEGPSEHVVDWHAPASKLAR